MERRVLIVTDSFLLRGIGLLLAPGIGELSPPLQIGDQLRFVRPDGSEVESVVRQLHWLHAPNPIPNPFLALPEFQPADVPPGTVVMVSRSEIPGRTKYA